MPSSGNRHAKRDPEEPLSRVVIVTSGYPGRGGVESAVSNLAAAFRMAGVSVQIVSILPGPEGMDARNIVTIFDRRSKLQRGSIFDRPLLQMRNLNRVPLLPVKRWDRFRGLRVLRELLSHGDESTLVIVTSPRVATYVADCGALEADRRAAVVVQYHLPYDAQVSLEGEGLPVSRTLQVDGFVSLSQSDAERFSETLSTRCRYIPNPSSSQGIKVPAARQLMAAPSGERRAVALCRLSGEKQLDVMIRAFLKATEPEGLSAWRLDIYGEGPERSALEKQIKETPGASRRVCLRGWVADPSRALHGAGLLLSTSRFEAFGMSILDAAQVGVPAIAFACSPGVVDLVNHLGGVLVPPDDLERFAAQLRLLLSRSEELARMGRCAAERSERYGTNAIVGDWRELFREIRAAQVDGIEHGVDAK